MPRLNAALLGALTLIVLVLGLIVVYQKQTVDRLDELTCLERLDATAAITALIPDAKVDVDGRVDAARLLSAKLDAC